MEWLFVVWWLWGDGTVCLFLSGHCPCGMFPVNTVCEMPLFLIFVIYRWPDRSSTATISSKQSSPVLMAKVRCVPRNWNVVDIGECEYIRLRTMNVSFNRAVQFHSTLMSMAVRSWCAISSLNSLFFRVWIGNIPESDWLFNLYLATIQIELVIASCLQQTWQVKCLYSLRCNLTLLLCQCLTWSWCELEENLLSYTFWQCVQIGLPSIMYKSITFFHTLLTPTRLWQLPWLLLNRGEGKKPIASFVIIRCHRLHKLDHVITTSSSSFGPLPGSNFEKPRDNKEQRTRMWRRKKVPPNSSFIDFPCDRQIDDAILMHRLSTNRFPMTGWQIGRSCRMGKTRWNAVIKKWKLNEWISPEKGGRNLISGQRMDKLATKAGNWIRFSTQKIFN